MTKRKWEVEPDEAPGLLGNLACVFCSKRITIKTIELMKCEHCKKSISFQSTMIKKKYGKKL